MKMSNITSIEEFEKEFTEKYKDGNSLRTLYFWVKIRFNLEYGKNFEKNFIKFLNASGLDFLSENSFNINDNKRNYLQNHIDWINANPVQCENELQNYWAENQEDFLCKLANYRDNGTLDKNISDQLFNFAKNINNDSLRYIYEIIQNADDCEYEEDASITILLTSEQKIEVYYNEVGMLYSDIIALTTIGQSNKKNRKKKRLIGEKGIGFKTIFSVCKSVEVYSGAYAFRLKDNQFSPEFLRKCDPKQSGTKLKLNVRMNGEQSETDEKNISGLTLKNQIFERLLDKYGFSKGENGKWELDKQKAFQNCPVLFTNKLTSITIQYGGESFTISNEYKFNTSNDNEDICLYSGKLVYKVNDTEIEIIEYYGMIKNVELSYDEYISRYPDQFTKEEFEVLENKEYITYPIKILAVKDTKEIKQGCLYSFLPTSTIIKAPINIQLPVKLNLDRSCVHFVGDSDTNSNAESTGGSEKLELSKWSQRMFKELYELIPEFYNKLKENTDIFLYIPEFKVNNHHLFTSDEKYSVNINKLNKYSELFKYNGMNLFEIFKKIPYFKKANSKDYCMASQAIMFDEWIHTNFAEDYFEQLQINKGKDEKFLVEYNENAGDYASCFGFRAYIPNDDSKTELLNGVIEVRSNLRETIQKHVSSKEQKSEYVPEDISGLRIYPVKRNDNLIQYITYKNYIWFLCTDKQWAYTCINSKICFLSEHFLSEDIEFPENIKFHECTPQNIWCNVFNIDNKDKELFEDLMDLLYRMGNILPKADDWKKATEQLLKATEHNGFWRANRIEQLITFLVQNAPKFAGVDEKEIMYIQYHILGVLAHAKKKGEGVYKLPPIETWTGEFCETLNSVEFGGKVKFSIDERELIEANNELYKNFNQINGLDVKQIYRYDDLKMSYVHFGNTVILKEEEKKIIQNCMNSISKKLAIFFKLNPIRNEILNKTQIFKDKNEAEEFCINIAKLFCVEFATSNSNQVTKNGENEKYSNDPFYELLQNANDHIVDRTMNISIESDSLTFYYNEETGFTARDFFAICTVGNSGNVAYQQTVGNDNATGHKGTGFKSVYNYFKKVEIKGEYVTCILDTNKEIDYQKTLNATKVDVTLPEWNEIESKEDYMTYYPYPYFEFHEKISNPTTSIKLTFKNDKIKREFLEKYKLNSVNDFEITQEYYFLNNIETIKLNDDKCSKEINREQFIKDTFFKYSYYFKLEGVELDKIPYSKKNKEGFEVEFLFPKTIPENFGTYSKIYCTLPIKNLSTKKCESGFKQLKFYVNCIAWELTDTRDNIAQEKFMDWANFVDQKVLCGDSSKNRDDREESCLEQAFTVFASEHLDIAYKYFPYEYANKWEYLKDIPFLSTTNGVMSLSQWYCDLTKNPQNMSYEDNQNGFVILPMWMYKWFNETGELDNYETSVPFLYYYNNDNWFKNLEILCKKMYDTLDDKNDKSKKNYEKSVVTDIKNFYEKKFYQVGVFNIPEDSDGEKKYKYKELYKSILRSIIGDEIFLLEEKKHYCYRWYLGKTICEQEKVHNFDTEDNINGYVSLKENIDKIEKFFGEVEKNTLFHCFKNKLNSEDIEKDLKKIDFYKKKTPEIWESYFKYIKYTEDIIKVICEFLDNYNQDDEKIKDLFQRVLKSKQKCCLNWKTSYFKFLKIYCEIMKRTYESNYSDVPLKFTFSNSEITTLPDYIKQKLKDRLNSEDYAKYKEEQKEQIHFSTIYNGGYCVANIQEKSVLVVFGEKGLGQFLKDFLDIQAYLSPKQYVSMFSYSPLPLFREYDSLLDNLKLPESFPEYSDYAKWKLLLLQRYEFQDEDKKWRCYAGYGDPELYHGSCPVCDGKLLVEATSLRVKTVRLCQDIHIPVLLCCNCSEAFQYSQDVFFCKGENDDTKICIDNVKEYLMNNDKMYICFQLSDYEPKIYPIKMTLLHRKIALDKVSKINSK